MEREFISRFSRDRPSGLRAGSAVGDLHFESAVENASLQRKSAKLVGFWFPTLFQAPIIGSSRCSTRPCRSDLGLSECLMSEGEQHMQLNSC